MALGNVNKDTITSDVWNNFYYLIDTNVNSVSIFGSGGANSKTVSIQNVSSSFPDKILDDSTSYPLVIVNPPECSFSDVTFRDREMDCSVEIEILATQSEASDKFMDLINKTIRDNEDGLNATGIEELTLTDTSNDSYTRGGIKLHSRKVVWNFKFSF